MSHISVMKIGFADRSLLLDALKALGCEIDENEGQVITDGKKTCKVEFTAEIAASGTIGFRKSKAGWQLVADWFKVLTDRKQFENKLKQQYALLAVRQQLGGQGFYTIEETKDSENRIHILVRRTAP